MDVTMSWPRYLADVPTAELEIELNRRKVNEVGAMYPVPPDAAGPEDAILFPKVQPPFRRD